MEKKSKEFLEALNDSYSLNKEYSSSITTDLDNIKKRIEKLEEQKELLELKIVGIDDIMVNVKKSVEQLILFDPNKNDKNKVVPLPGTLKKK